MQEGHHDVVVLLREGYGETSETVACLVIQDAWMLVSVSTNDVALQLACLVSRNPVDAVGEVLQNVPDRR